MLIDIAGIWERENHVSFPLPLDEERHGRTDNQTFEDLGAEGILRTLLRAQFLVLVINTLWVKFFPALCLATYGKVVHHCECTLFPFWFYSIFQF